MSTLKLFVCYLQYFVWQVFFSSIYRTSDLSFLIMKTLSRSPAYFLERKCARFRFLIGSREPSTHPVSVKLSTLRTALPSSFPLIRKPVSKRIAHRHIAAIRPRARRFSFSNDAAAAPAPTAARKLISELAYPRDDSAAPSDAYSTDPHRRSAAAQTVHAVKARSKKERSKDFFSVSDKKTPPADMMIHHTGRGSFSFKKQRIISCRFWPLPPPSWRWWRWPTSWSGCGRGPRRSRR